ncbi:MAG: preprotein translocase subunit SecE [Epulopiscium sp.]|nr:preprotein translocase subunit SecE [Candidatus Epulonipiscium sp.]
MADNNSAQVSEKKTQKSNSSKKINKFLKGFKGEFKKVIWPNREALFKQTTTVIVVSVLVGITISLMDFVIGAGIHLIVR